MWCEHFDAIASPLARKLSALGLVTLLALPSAAVLPMLDVITSHAASVWMEVEKSGDDDEAGTLYCSPIYFTGAWGHVPGTSRVSEEDEGGGGFAWVARLHDAVRHRCCATMAACTKPSDTWHPLHRSL
jgi:hypothetical protein